MKKYDFSFEKSPEDNRDWILEKIFNQTKDITAELDLRDSMLPVRDQGNQGSCGALASSAMKEYQERIDIGLREYLSPQFIYNNRINKEINGMYCRDIMRILLKLGVCREITYKYNTKKEISDKAKKEAENFKISNYAKITTIEGTKQALIENGPVLIGVPVYSGKNFWKKENDEDKSRGGHAVAIVGYNKEGFIIRNSWGKTWNKDGHIVIPYEDFDCIWELWTIVDTKSVKKWHYITTKFGMYMKRFWRWICKYKYPIIIVGVFVLILSGVGISMLVSYLSSAPNPIP